MVKLEHIARNPRQDVIFDGEFHLNCQNGYVSPLEQGVFTQVNLILDDEVFYDKYRVESFMRFLCIAGEREAYFIRPTLYGFKVKLFFVSEKWMDPFSFTGKEFCDYLSWRIRKISLDDESSTIFIENEIFLRNQKKVLQIADKIYKAVPLEELSESMVMLNYLSYWAQPLIDEEREREQEKLSMVKTNHIARYPRQDFIFDDDYCSNYQNGYISPLEEGVFTRVNLFLSYNKFFDTELSVQFLQSLCIAGKSPTILGRASNFSSRTPVGIKVQLYFRSETWIDPLSSTEKTIYHSIFWRKRQVSLVDESSMIFVKKEILLKNRKKALQLAKQIHKAVPLEKLSNALGMLKCLSNWAKPLIYEDYELKKRKS